MAFHQTGSTAAHLQNFRWSYDPNSGLVGEQEWAALNQASILAKRAACIRSGYGNSYSYDNNTCQYTLTVTDTSGSYVADTWQIRNTERQIPVTKNPRHDYATGDVPIRSDELDLISALFNGTAEDYKTYTELKAYLASVSSTNALNLLERMNRGETHYSASDYIVLHTTNIGANYTGFNTADVGVNQIWTMSDFLDNCVSADLWGNGALKGRMSQKLAAIVADAPPVRSGYLFGALKQASSEATAADNRVDISVEWWLSQWSTDEYALA